MKDTHTTLYSYTGKTQELSSTLWACQVSFYLFQLSLLSHSEYVISVAKKKMLTFSSFAPLNLVRVNLAFYLIAFGALVYFVDMDYGYAATCLFTRWFPKEAEVLGFKPVSD